MIGVDRGYFHSIHHNHRMFVTSRIDELSKYEAIIVHETRLRRIYSHARYRVISTAREILICCKYAIRRISFSDGLTDARRPVHIARIGIKGMDIHHGTQIEIEPKVAHLDSRARR